MIRYDKHVVAKDFDFEIPQFVQDSIDLLINGINSGDLMADCYMSDLANNINNCLHVCLTDSQADELRNYYIRGGMYNV